MDENINFIKIFILGIVVCLLEGGISYEVRDWIPFKCYPLRYLTLLGALNFYS
jgi:hypothetical protein